jgi:Uma2 family endonuclease
MATHITTETTNPRIPSLQQGDHLTRDEFERRYEAMPHLKKAELIEGIVYMSSPVRLDQHAEPQMAFVGWLTYYRAYTPGVRGGDNATVRLDLENEPQPDGLLFRGPGLGGRAVVSPAGYLEGAPDLVVEIAASSVSYDLNTKLRVYRRNQVQEYIVWRVEESAIDWFTLQRGEYVRLPLSKSGFYQSNVFPSLRLDPEAMLRGDLPTVFKVLGDGIASPEHEAFVAKNKPS